MNFDEQSQPNIQTLIKKPKEIKNDNSEIEEDIHESESQEDSIKESIKESIKQS